MGFIPIFLTLAGACFLFFVTVRNSFLQKLQTEKKLLEQIRGYLPKSISKKTSISSTDWILLRVDSFNLNQEEKKDLLNCVKDLKINRIAYNKLRKKAPYNWVAKLSGFHEI